MWVPLKVKKRQPAPDAPEPEHRQHVDVVMWPSGQCGGLDVTLTIGCAYKFYARTRVELQLTRQLREKYTHRFVEHVKYGTLYVIWNAG